MMKYLLVVGLVGLPFGALAQTAPDPLSDLSQDWQSMGAVNRHVAEDVQRLIQAYQSLKAENEKLKLDAAKNAPHGDK